jgi:hypothetical protein
VTSGDESGHPTHEQAHDNPIQQKKPKGETKMKKLSKRNRILIAIAGVVVIVVAVGLVLNLTGVIGGPLQGAILGYIGEDLVCILYDGGSYTVHLYNYDLRTRWNFTQNTGAVSLVSTTRTSATVASTGISGNATLRVEGGPTWRDIDTALIYSRNMCPSYHSTALQFLPNRSTVFKQSCGPGQWVSSNPSVVTIDQTGRITTVAVGTARITHTGPRCSLEDIDIEVVASNPAPFGIYW